MKGFPGGDSLGQDPPDRVDVAVLLFPSRKQRSRRIEPAGFQASKFYRRQWSGEFEGLVSKDPGRPVEDSASPLLPSLPTLPKI